MQASKSELCDHLSIWGDGCLKKQTNKQEKVNIVPNVRRYLLHLLLMADVRWGSRSLKSPLREPGGKKLNQSIILKQTL